MKYTAERYTGRNIGNSFMARVGWQVVANDETTGKRRALFASDRGKSPCLKSSYLASHYRSGLNKHDRRKMQSYKERAETLAAAWNKKQPY